MAVSVDHSQAWLVLAEAFARATSEEALPDDWLERTKRVGQSPCKTYVAVLGTILLAKATNQNVDVFALKATSESAGAYGPRMLAEFVLVPFAADNAIHLGSHGRQPWNNQPWFRYDFANESMRIAQRCRASFRYLLECFHAVSKLDKRAAGDALAAYLRNRWQVESAVMQLAIGAKPLTLSRLADRVTTFLNEEGESGKRGQALVAAALDVVFPWVETGTINDPSRRRPGDVIIFDAQGQPVQSIEVRQKLVTATDIRIFAQALQRAEIGRGAVVALHPKQTALPRIELVKEADKRFQVNLLIIEGAEELIRLDVAWSKHSTADALAILAQRMSERLHQLEVRPTTVAAWQAVIDKLTTA